MRDQTGWTDPAEHAGRRQNLAVAAMAVTAIVAIVTVVVGPWRGGGEMPDNEGQANPELVVAPPGVDSRRPHLIVSPASVPAAGGDVALILANPGAEQVSFSVTGLLDRWDGSAWVNHRQVTAGLRAEAPAGKLVSLDEDLVVPLIYIGVEPGTFSRPHWTHVEGIEPGWYRFTFGTAAGLLQVGPRGAAPTRPTTAFAFDSEGVVRAGAEGTLNLSVMPRKRLRGAFDEEELVGHYLGKPRVERLDGERWKPLAEGAVVSTEDSDGIAGPFTVRLPALAAGVYRISRDTSIAGPIESLFWVAPLE